MDNDNADVLRKTIIPPLEEALSLMLKGKVATGTDPDGMLALFCDADGETTWSFDPDTSPGTEWTELARFPFRVLVTGDLAFYAMLLGKENENGHHCPLCKLTHSNWQDVDHERSEHWTLEELQRVGEQAAAGYKRLFGVICQPLSKYIAPDRFMFPPLHVKLGFNTLLSRFYDFVDSLDGMKHFQRKSKTPMVIACRV